MGNSMGIKGSYSQYNMIFPNLWLLLQEEAGQRNHLGLGQGFLGLGHTRPAWFHQRGLGCRASGWRQELGG